jgi:hypothetical protein
MTKDTVVAFRAPEGFSPAPLTHLLRKGARELIAQAVEAELNAFLAADAGQTDAAGRKRLARHGHLPEREVQTGIGAVAVRVPRVRDRAPECAPLWFDTIHLSGFDQRGDDGRVFGSGIMAHKEGVFAVLVSRRCMRIDGTAAHDLAHDGIEGETFGIVDILVSGQTPEHRLAD